MSDIAETTRAQTKFLRTFATAPFGPGVEDWPSAAVLRRWMRRPGFVQAMRSIKDTMRYQADFQLLSAAAAAAHMLQNSIAAGDHEVQRTQILAMSNLLRLSHMRQRFSPPEPPAPLPSGAKVLQELRSFHPDASVADAQEALGAWLNSLEEHEKARGEGKS